MVGPVPIVIDTGILIGAKKAVCPSIQSDRWSECYNYS